MVYIDIFPYDYVPENKVLRLIKGFNANILMFIASCVMDHRYMDENYKAFLQKAQKGKLFLLIRKITGTIFSFYKPERWFDIVDKSIQYDKETSLMTSATGRRHYFNEIYPTTVFLPLSELPFQGYPLYVPGNWNEYLVGNYGSNYMIPPDESKRESHFITEIKI